VGLTGITPWTAAFGVRYTWTRSRDRLGGMGALGGSSGNTEGDPRRSDWAFRDLNRTHYFQGSILQRVGRWVELTAVAHLTSGIPYTPMTDGDVNGDGLFNDRAFVFDPRAADDPEIADAMAALLREAPSSARACLQDQMGRVATRNACRSGWHPTLDLGANIRPGRLGLSRRLLLNVRAQNALAGVDHLLHGASGARGWGQYPWVDGTLLRVRGFDPEAQRFQYEVNPHFGQSLAVRDGFRLPFTVTVQARVSVGADPAFQQLAGAVRALEGARRPVDEVRRELAARVPNLPARVLEEDVRRRLNLTADQVEHLRTAASALAGRIDSVTESLAGHLAASAGSRSPPVTALLEEAERLVAEGLHAARQTLSPAQWNRLPRALREPQRTLPQQGSQRVGIPAG
jgi:hypothetical protein